MLNRLNHIYNDPLTVQALLSLSDTGQSTDRSVPNRIGDIRYNTAGEVLEVNTVDGWYSYAAFRHYSNVSGYYLTYKSILSDKLTYAGLVRN